MVPLGMLHHQDGTEPVNQACAKTARRGGNPPGGMSGGTPCGSRDDLQTVSWFAVLRTLISNRLRYIRS